MNESIDLPTPLRLGIVPTTETHAGYWRNFEDWELLLKEWFICAAAERRKQSCVWDGLGIKYVSEG